MILAKKNPFYTGISPESHFYRDFAKTHVFTGFYENATVSQGFCGTLSVFKAFL